MTMETKKSKGVGSLRLEGWRKFNQPIEVELGKVNFLLGPNNAGKSSFLNAFKFIALMSQRNWPISIPSDVKAELSSNILNKDSQVGLLVSMLNEVRCEIEFSKRHEEWYKLTLSDNFCRVKLYHPDVMTSDFHDFWRGALVYGDFVENRTLEEIDVSLRDKSDTFMGALEGLPSFCISLETNKFLLNLERSGKRLTVVDSFVIHDFGIYDYQVLGHVELEEGKWYVLLNSAYALEVVYVADSHEDPFDDDFFWTDLTDEDREAHMSAWEGLWHSYNWSQWPDNLKGAASSPWEVMINEIGVEKELVPMKLAEIEAAFLDWREEAQRSFYSGCGDWMLAGMMDKGSEYRSIGTEMADMYSALFNGLGLHCNYLPSLLNRSCSDKMLDQVGLSLGGRTFPHCVVPSNISSELVRRFYNLDLLKHYRRELMWISPSGEKMEDVYHQSSCPFKEYLWNHRYEERLPWIDGSRIADWDFEISRCLMFMGLGGGFKVVCKKNGEIRLSLRELKQGVFESVSSLKAIRKSYNAVSKPGKNGWLKEGEVLPTELGRAARSMLWIFINLCELRVESAHSDTPYVVVLEEPAAFLHPNIASRFTEVIRHLAAVLGLVILVETHSEYMLRQLSTSRLNGDSLEDVRIHYFGAPGAEAVMPIRVDRDGVFNPAIPEGFLDKSSSMLREQRELKRNRKSK